MQSSLQKTKLKNINKKFRAEAIVESLPYVETECWNAWISYCCMKNIIFPSSNLFWNLMKAKKFWAYCFSGIRLKECNCELLGFFLCTIIDLPGGHSVSWVCVLWSGHEDYYIWEAIHYCVCVYFSILPII